MAKDNRREERRARKQKKAEDKKLMDAANKKAESITSTNTVKAKKQKVDKKTGLTIADEPTVESGGVMGGNFGEGDVTTSTVKQVARDKSGNVIEGKEAIKKALLYGEATQSQQETLTKSGKPLSVKQQEKRKERQEAPAPVVEEKVDLGDLDPDFADQSSPIPDSSDEVSPRKARRQNKRYYNKLEKSEQKVRNQEARNITENLKDEAKATSPNAEVLLEKLEVASELERQVKREEKEQKKAKKKIERIDRKTGGILGVLSSLVPPEMKDGLTNLKPKDLVELASKFGIEDTEGDGKGGKNSMASGYIDTIEKLGVQDYFPNAGQSIAVGTFSGARIGSETIYAGGGANLPLGLYDARKRALKAKFGATQKTMSQLADFTKLPPTYRRDVQDGLTARYNEIQADNSLSPQEKATKLEGLNSIVDEITYAYNSAKAIYNVQLGNDGDNIYIGQAQSDDITDILGNLMDPDMLEKYMSGDNKYNMAKDAVEKLQFHKNILQDVEEVATQMKGFEKTANVDAYLNSLNPDHREEFNTLIAQDDKSGFTNSVYFTNMKKFYAKDVDQLFDDNFLDDEGNLRPEYSEEQKKKGKSYLNAMLEPYYEQEVIQIATGNAAKGRDDRAKARNKFIFKEQFTEESDEFPDIMSRDAYGIVAGLEALGVVRMDEGTNAQGKVYSVERDVKFPDYLQGKDNYLRVNPVTKANDIYIRVTVNGKQELISKTDLAGKPIDNRGNYIGYTATDGSNKINKSDLEGLNESQKVEMVKNVVTPGYKNENNRLMAVEVSGNNKAAYSSSNSKTVIYQDVGRPVYIKEVYDDQTAEWVEEEVRAPFTVQGNPYENTLEQAQKNDLNYSKSQKSETNDGFTE